MITAVPIVPKYDEYHDFIERTRFLLDNQPRDFLNQSLYDTTIITLVQKCRLEELELLCRLCSLNSKRFLPFWGMVIDKYKQSPAKEEFFTLLVAMTFNIGPFINGTSSKRTNLSTLSYETLSQSINRHLNFLLDECGSHFEIFPKYLPFYRKIITNTNRHPKDLGQLVSVIISLIKEKPNDPELSKFICLLIKRFDFHVFHENLAFLASLNNSYITKALIRKYPLLFNNINDLEDEILKEYCLGILENSLTDPNLLEYLKRLKNDKQFIEKLIVIPEIKEKRIVQFIANVVNSLYPLMLPELIKHTDQEIIEDLTNLILEKKFKTESDWEAIANSLNRLENVSLYADKIELSNLSFQKLRCHLSIIKSGKIYGVQSFIDRFIQTDDTKEIIILSLIILNLHIPIDQHIIEQKISLSVDPRLLRHLNLLLPSNRAMS
jgi:hypothetical protein